MFACCSVIAQPDPLNILILNSYSETAAPYFQPTERFKTKLQELHSGSIAFQHADLRQHGSDAQSQIDETIVQLILKRYAESPPQLVLAAGPPAIDFWIEHRSAIFPDAMLIAMARESYLRQAELQPADAVVATQFSFTGAVENMLQLLPTTKRIVMVFGDSLSERTLSAGARDQLAPFAEQLSLEFTNDLTIPEVQERLAALPDHSVVFYGIFSKDINGVELQQFSGLAMAKAASNAPVFGAFDDQMGHGIIGGSLIQVGLIGDKMAEAAQALLSEPEATGSWTTVELAPPTYDWRELQAWNIGLDRLPENSIVRFEPPSFWDRYSTWFIPVIVFVTAQSLLLFALLLQLRRRRKAENAYASLSRRLITAHEDERKLIARELHDDLSQRLARAAIDAGFARSNHGEEKADEAIKTLHAELVSISKDVHDMSYRLHPSLVDDVGIVVALRSEVERVRRMTEVALVENIGDIQAQPPRDVALCLFRIAQEALQNAVKHAQASTIEVLLEETQAGLILAVRDDGIGFNFEKVRDGFSLGLSSMRERAVLVSGTLNIRSEPGEGTRVSILVPTKGASK